MRLSLSQLQELTGRDRMIMKKQLESLPPISGKRGALLYESREALPLIYSVGNLEAARAKQALSQAALNAVREEELRKYRVPREEVLDVVDRVFQALGSTLKAAKGKKLTALIINELFGKFRASLKRLK
jgi:hypothetical protein